MTPVRSFVMLFTVFSTIIAYEFHANVLFTDCIGLIYKWIVSPIAEEQIVTAKPGNFGLYDEHFGMMHVAFNFLLLLGNFLYIRKALATRRRYAWFVALSVCLILLNIRLFYWQI